MKQTYHIRSLCRLSCTAALTILCIPHATAQQSTESRLLKNLGGKWKMEEIGEKGKGDMHKSPFNSYKFYGDNHFLMFSIEDKEKDKKHVMEAGTPIRFNIKTGYLSAPSDKKIVEGYDTVSIKMEGKRLFNLTWQNFLTNYTAYPIETFVEEKWRKTRYPKEAEWFISALAMNGKIQNRFTGMWQREQLFVYVNNDYLKGVIIPVKDCKMYKVYGDKVSLLLGRIDLESNLKTIYIAGEMRTQKYISESALEENGIPCLIDWKDEDTFQLTYFDDNHYPYIEIWKRMQIPMRIQQVFKSVK